MPAGKKSDPFSQLGREVTDRVNVVASGFTETGMMPVITLAGTV